MPVEKEEKEQWWGKTRPWYYSRKEIEKIRTKLVTVLLTVQINENRQLTAPL